MLYIKSEKMGKFENPTQTPHKLHTKFSKILSVKKMPHTNPTQIPHKFGT